MIHAVLVCKHYSVYTINNSLLCNILNYTVYHTLRITREVVRCIESITVLECRYTKARSLYRAAPSLYVVVHDGDRTCRVHPLYTVYKNEKFLYNRTSSACTMYNRTISACTMYNRTSNAVQCTGIARSIVIAYMYAIYTLHLTIRCIVNAV